MPVVRFWEKRKIQKPVDPLKEACAKIRLENVVGHLFDHLRKTDNQKRSFQRLLT